MVFSEVLLIHLGGLGDCCLSESIFYSLSQHFDEPVVALGTKRLLTLFGDYFDRVHGIESARWLYLFSSKPSDITWQQIAFIGKDREGSLRERWQRISRQPLLFIDMYPDGAFNEKQGIETKCLIHIEDYQLSQLGQYGIKAIKKEILQKEKGRVIIYPEKGFSKEKWHYRNFLDLYHSLEGQGISTCMIAPADLAQKLPEALSIPDLAEVKKLFEEGGIFVSNDSGMAHLAGACGLYTITIFNDFEPLIWRPRGLGHALKTSQDRIDVASIETIIANQL
jgi:ADP-heptose:LPS heptosyltransferase